MSSDNVLIPKFELSLLSKKQKLDTRSRQLDWQQEAKKKKIVK
jgi:hypothetical protein